MKVALIHPHIGYKGGLETRLWNYIRWLRALDHAVTVFGYKMDSGVKIPEGVHIHQFDFSRIPKPIRMSVFNWQLSRQQIIERFDFSLSLGRTSHQTDVLVPGVHRAYLKAMTRRWRTPADWQNSFLDNLAYTRSERVWAASHLVKEQIQLYHKVDSTKIQVLFPPLDTTRFYRQPNVDREVLRQSLGWNPEDRIVLFVSTSHRLKGWPLLEQVWHQMGDMAPRLIVAGHPIRSEHPRITPAGFIENMAPLYLAADLMVLPSLYESFGQVVSEALACGTPVIVSDRVGAKEILEEPWGKVLPYNDATAWAKAIKQMLQDTPSVPADIVARHHLSVEEHMQRLMGHLA